MKQTAETSEIIFAELLDRKALVTTERRGLTDVEFSRNLVGKKQIEFLDRVTLNSIYVHQADCRCHNVVGRSNQFMI